MVSMAAESTDTERAQTSASQLVHCAQHASAVEWICAGSSECARSNSTHTSKLLLHNGFLVNPYIPFLVSTHMVHRYTRTPLYNIRSGVNLGRGGTVG